MQYKTIEVKKNRFFFGPIAGEKIEDILNEQAKKGWIFNRTIETKTKILRRKKLILVFHKED